MNDREQPPQEVGLTDIIDMLWDAKVALALVTAFCLAVAVVAYFVLPERFRAVTDVRPLTAADFAEFSALEQTRNFEYTRGSLLWEYSKYLSDLDLLKKAEAAAGIPAGDPVLVSFEFIERQLRDRQPGNPDLPRELESIRFTASYGDDQLLDAFVVHALKSASSALADALRVEIGRRVAAAAERREWQIKEAELMVAAEREKLKAQRQDEIVRLNGDVQIARAFGLDRPLELQAQALTVARSTPVVVPRQSPRQADSDQRRDNPATNQRFDTTPPASFETPDLPVLPRYFDGYLALEAQRNLLAQRDNDDAYIANLREIEKQIFLLKNNVEPAQVDMLLAGSILATPETATLASYSIAQVRSDKVFPRLSVFLGGGLGVGLLLGGVIAITRGMRRYKVVPHGTNTA